MIGALVSAGAQAVARGLVLAGIMVVIGATLFLLRIAPLFAGDSTQAQQVARRTRRLLRLACLVLALAAVWRLVQQSAAFADVPSAWPSMVLLVLTQMAWGTGWGVQMTGLLLAVLASGAATRRRGAIVPLGIGALILATSPAMMGHAIGAPRLVPLVVFADTLHVLAAGGWLGTLLVVAVAALPLASHAAAPGRAIAILDRFSPIALTSAVLIALTGVFASWMHLETLGALWSSTYGRTLLVKLGILAGVAALGAYNWRVATPALQASGDTRAIRRSALVELTLAALLVAVTAVLVATPLPSEM
ncbi:MAG: CopD family protein [Gemmatimonadota bacterium]